MRANPLSTKLLFKSLLLCLLISSQVWSVARAQEPTISPDQFSFSVLAGSCSSDQLTVQTVESPPPSLDVAFLIDNTSSMQSIIDEVNNNIQPIAQNIQTISSDTQFALATVADYPNPVFFNEGIEPWVLQQPFTTDLAELQAATASFSLFNSGEQEEAYLRGLYESQFLAWRPDARRIVILFGDSPAHNPDAGPDGQLGTADDLTQIDVVNQLNAANITVLAVSGNADAFFQEVVAATNGEFFGLSTADQVPDAVQDLLVETVSRISILTLQPTAPGDTWLSWDPSLHGTVEAGEQRTFALTLCVPENTLAGDYGFEAEVLGDGFSLGQVPLAVIVPPQANLTLSQTFQPDIVSQGESFSYVFDVTNDGIDTATELTFNATVPPEVAIESIEASQGGCEQIGQSITCVVDSLAPGEQLTISIAAVPTSAGTFAAEAAVTAAEVSAAAANNQSERQLVVGGAADLSLAQTEAPEVAVVGEDVTYGFAVRNDGPSPATEAVLTLTPAVGVQIISAETDIGSCSQTADGLLNCDLGTLAVGEAANIAVTVNTAGAGPLFESITLTAQETDPNTSNDSFNQDIVLDPAADLTYALTNPDDPATIDAPYTYQLLLGNNGPSAATGIELSGQLPASTEFVSAESSQGSCEAADNTVRCQIERLESGQEVEVSVVVIPRAEDGLNADFSLNGNELDPDPTNSSNLMGPALALVGSVDNDATDSDDNQISDDGQSGDSTTVDEVTGNDDTASDSTDAAETTTGSEASSGSESSTNGAFSSSGWRSLLAWSNGRLLFLLLPFVGILAFQIYERFIDPIISRK